MLILPAGNQCNSCTSSALPSWQGGIVADDIRAGTLVALSLDRPTVEFGGIYAVFLPDRNPAAKVRAFIEFIAKRFAPEPPWDQKLES